MVNPEFKLILFLLGLLLIFGDLHTPLPKRQVQSQHSTVPVHSAHYPFSLLLLYFCISLGIYISTYL